MKEFKINQNQINDVFSTLWRGGDLRGSDPNQIIKVFQTLMNLPVITNDTKKENEK